MKRTGVALVALAVLVLAGFALAPTEPAPSVPRATRAPKDVAAAPVPVVVRSVDPPEEPADARPLPRVLEADAVRAGQIAGQLAEVRYRLARADVRCAPGLEPLAAAFAAARTHPDAADWRSLGAELAVAVDEIDRCGVAELEPAEQRLRGWLREAPLGG